MASLEKGQIIKETANRVLGQGTDGLRNWTLCSGKETNGFRKWIWNRKLIP
jgi:hypothetical protein